MNGKNIAIIPGVFDPVTNGHLDVVVRAAKLFDIIYVVSFDNSAKKTMFTSGERLEMLRLACEDIEGREKITVDVTNELLVDYAKSKGAGFVIKGVRNIIDFEYEYMMYEINREIGNDIDTLFLPAKSDQLYISSTFVREMVSYQREIIDYVPLKVNDYIAGLLQNGNRHKFM